MLSPPRPGLDLRCRNANILYFRFQFGTWVLVINNRPFPSSLVPLFQNESKWEPFHMKMSSALSFIFIQIKVIFICRSTNGFALRLTLKQRHKGTRKCRATVDLIRRSWVRFPPRSKDFFFTSCGSLIPFTRANAQWVIHGFN